MPVRVPDYTPSGIILGIICSTATAEDAEQFIVATPTPFIKY